MENLYKDIFNQILYYLAIEDIFHLTHTSKWMCEKIKESNLSNQLEAEIFEGSVCTICCRKYKKTNASKQTNNYLLWKTCNQCWHIVIA